MAKNPITKRRSQVSKAKRDKKELRFPREKTIELPDTKRFCLGCRKRTTFKFNPVIGHSRCKACGGSYSQK